MWSRLLPASMANPYRAPMARVDQRQRTVKTIDAELAQAAWRRVRHGDCEISRKGNMIAIDILLDERLKVAGR